MDTPREEATRFDIFNVVGGVALVLTLALTSPGVHVARASDDGLQGSAPASSMMTVDPALAVAPAAPAPADASCSVDASPAERARAATQAAARSQQEVLARLAKQHAPGTGNPEIVVLNNRGYSYSNPHSPNPHNPAR